MTDKLNKSIELNRSNVLSSGKNLEDFMSKPLMKLEEKKRFRGLLDLAKKAEKPTGESVEVRHARSELFGLVELLLANDTIVLENDLTPNEAAEVAGISRNSILKMLKTGRLQGYEVGSHWKVSRVSLLKYLEDREDMMRMMSKIDESGFGIDQDE